MFVFMFADGPQPCKPPLNLEDWMEKYGTELLRLCFLYIKDYQLAEDALQDTFVKAYLKYDSFRGESSVRTWLTSIAINVCRDFLRRQSVREHPLLLPRDEAQAARYLENRLSQGQPEDPMESSDDKLTLLQIVTGLPGIYRETILLYYYNGLSAKEIARIQRCALPTVNVRLKRGRELIKAALGSDGKDE